MSSGSEWPHALEDPDAVAQHQPQAHAMENEDVVPSSDSALEVSVPCML